MQRDPPCVAPHQLHHHHPVVALSGGMQLVDRLGGGGDRAVEAEGDQRAGHVVVDGLRHADHRQALGPEIVGDPEAAVAADGHERVEAARAEGGDEVIGAVHLGHRAVRLRGGPAEGIAAVGGPEDGAAEVGDAADGGGVEGHDAVVAQQPAEPATDPVALPAALVRGQHDGPDDGVEPRGVAAARGNCDPHGGQARASRTRRSTSPGSAWRLSACFEKMGRPSMVTSNTPPEDSMSCTSASGYDCFSSAARPAARGR